MSRWWLSGLLSGAVVVFSQSSHADEKNLPPVGEKLQAPKTEAPAALPQVAEAPPAPGCASCSQTITRQKVTLVEEQTASTRDKLAIRESVQAQAAQALEVEYREEKSSVTEMVLKPRECEQVVCINVVKAVTTVDPLTGKPCTHYETHPETRVVKVTVYDLVPQTRDVIVRVPCLKTVDRVVLVKRLCAYPTTEAVIENRLRAELTTNELAVPACPAPAPCAAPGCAAPGCLGK